MPDGVGADHFGRRLDVDAAQPRRAGKQRIGAEAKAGRDRAAHILAFAPRSLQTSSPCRNPPRCTARRIARMRRSQSARLSAPSSVGIVDQHRHSGLDARLDEHRLELEIASHTWRRVDSTGGTTDEMMMCVTWLGAMPCISNRLTKKTPYSSTVCVRCVVTRQCAASSGFSAIERRGPAPCWYCRHREQAASFSSALSFVCGANAAGLHGHNSIGGFDEQKPVFIEPGRHACASLRAMHFNLPATNPC